MQVKCGNTIASLLVSCLALLASIASPSALSAAENVTCFNSCTADYLACIMVFDEADCAAQRAICTKLCGLKSDEQFGAIAYSVSTRKHGFARQYPSRVLAAQRALQECTNYSGAGDCAIVSWSAGWCSALALSSDGAWGAADGINVALAQSAAMGQCQLHTSKTCFVETSVCGQ